MSHKILFKTLLLILTITTAGCSRQHQFSEIQNNIFKVVGSEALKNVEYVIIIPQEGCYGCISYAEDFYKEF